MSAGKQFEVRVCRIGNDLIGLARKNLRSIVLGAGPVAGRNLEQIAGSVTDEATVDDRVGALEMVSDIKRGAFNGRADCACIEPRNIGGKKSHSAIDRPVSSSSAEGVRCSQIECRTTSKK